MQQGHLVTVTTFAVPFSNDSGKSRNRRMIFSPGVSLSMLSHPPSDKLFRKHCKQPWLALSETHLLPKVQYQTVLGFLLHPLGFGGT
jgi:hypothetical protein